MANSTYSAQSEALLAEHKGRLDVAEQLVRFLAERADHLNRILTGLRPILEAELAKRAAPVPERPERWQPRLGADGIPVIHINLGGRVRRFVSERGPDGQIAAMIEEPVSE